MKSGGFVVVDAGEPDPATKALAAELRKPHLAPSGSEARSCPPSESASEMDTVLLPLPDRASIAVLPFANMSGDPEQKYFADGMVDDILMALSRVRWLFVIARQSSFAYKGRTVEIDKILALHPNATVSRARIASFRHGWMYELYLDGLRKAGLPES